MKQTNIEKKTTKKNGRRIGFAILIFVLISNLIPLVCAYGSVIIDLAKNPTAVVSHCFTTFCFN